MFTWTGSGIRSILFDARLHNPAQFPAQLTLCPAQFASKKAHNFHFFPAPSQKACSNHSNESWLDKDLLQVSCYVLCIISVNWMSTLSFTITLLQLYSWEWKGFNHFSPKFKTRQPYSFFFNNNSEKLVAHWNNITLFSKPFIPTCISYLLNIICWCANEKKNFEHS